MPNKTKAEVEDMGAGIQLGSHMTLMSICAKFRLNSSWYKDVKTKLQESGVEKGRINADGYTEEEQEAIDSR